MNQKIEKIKDFLENLNIKIENNIIQNLEGLKFFYSTKLIK